MTGILFDLETKDLSIKEGSIETGDNTLQCIEQILISNRGEYKEFPLVGGEAVKLLHSNKSRFWPNRMRNMCKAMGINVKRVDYDRTGKIVIEV